MSNDLAYRSTEFEGLATGFRDSQDDFLAIAWGVLS
jgi:hypothetical protein